MLHVSQLMRVAAGSGHRLVALAQRAHLPQSFRDGVKHRGIGRENGLLRHRRHPQPALLRHGAVVQRLHAGQHFEQRGLAGAVAADQADPFAGFNSEIRTIEERGETKGEVGVLQSEKSHPQSVVGRCSSFFANGVCIGLAAVISKKSTIRRITTFAHIQ